MNNTRHPVSFIATHDPAKSERFYAQIMELTLIERTDFALVFDDHGQALRVQIVPDLSPVSHTVHGWRVRDIEAEVDALQNKGVIFEKFEYLPQDDTGIWTTPDGNKVAWFKDPSGNVLSFTQYV